MTDLASTSTPGAETSPVAHSQRRVRAARAALVAFVLCLLDVLTTWWGLSLGMGEQNPVALWLMSVGGMAFAALVTTVLYTSLAVVFGWLSRGLVLTFLAVKAVTVVANLAAILTHHL